MMNSWDGRPSIHPLLPSPFLLRVCIRETWTNQADIKQSHGDYRKVPAPTAYFPMMYQVQIVQSIPTRCPTSLSRRATGRGQQHISCYISFARGGSPASPQAFKRVTSCQGDTVFRCYCNFAAFNGLWHGCVQTFCRSLKNRMRAQEVEGRGTHSFLVSLCRTFTSLFPFIIISLNMTEGSGTMGQKAALCLTANNNNNHVSISKQTNVSGVN